MCCVFADLSKILGADQVEYDRCGVHGFKDPVSKLAIDTPGR